MRALLVLKMHVYYTVNYKRSLQSTKNRNKFKASVSLWPEFQSERSTYLASSQFQHSCMCCFIALLFDSHLFDYFNMDYKGRTSVRRTLPTLACTFNTEGFVWVLKSTQGTYLTASPFPKTLTTSAFPFIKVNIYFPIFHYSFRTLRDNFEPALKSNGERCSENSRYCCLEGVLGDCLDEIIHPRVMCAEQISSRTVKRTMKDQRDVFTTFG